MKQPVGILILSLALAASAPAFGQVTISASDLFNQPGEYYEAYSNDYDPTALVNVPWPVPSGLIGSAGPNQIWDFSKGPTNVVYRFDYLAATNVESTITADFPAAQMVERKTDQATGSVEYLFFTQVPGVGRTVYGAYSDLYSSLIDPAHVFLTPIVDFPDRISYGQEWSTVAVYLSNVFGDDNSDPTDPFAGGWNLELQVTQTSTLKADAWGKIILPDELGGSFVDGLRINETVTIDLGYQDPDTGGYQNIETDTARNYYWLAPDRGMVAALASTTGASGAPVPENFTTATQFWRMFATNKKPSTGPTCVTPDPVSDLRIRFNSGQVLLSWSKVNCATQYRVDYSTTTTDPAAWKPLSGIITNQFYVFDTTDQDPQRFYRVVSMK
jgi:hypothetical protein